MANDDYGATQEGMSQLQLQRTKADIKNVLPLDLYIAMTEAGLMAAELESGQNVPERRIKSFYANFYSVYNFTHARVTASLSGNTCSSRAMPVSCWPGAPMGWVAW